MRRLSVALAVAVVAVGAIQLFGVGVQRWKAEQYRRSRPWNAQLDSALAIRPIADVPGTYLFTECNERCEPGDTTKAWTLAELTLLPNPAETDDGSPVANGCLRYWAGRAKSEGLRDEATPKRWAQRRDGTVELSDIEDWCAHGCSEEVVVTEDGMIGISAAGDYMGGVSYSYIAGKRIGPPVRGACTVR